MNLSGTSVLAGLLLVAAAAVAAPFSLTQKEVTNPGNYWSIWGPATSSFVSATGLNSGVAQRVVISPKPEHPWDVGTTTGITKPVKKGDVLLLMFWARVVDMPGGSNLVLLSGRIYETGVAHGGISPETKFLLGKQWRPYYATGKAVKDYPAGALSAGLTIGVGEMVVEFGPVSVFDFGPDYNVNMLPHN